MEADPQTTGGARRARPGPPMPSDAEDQQLITRIARGDGTAFDELYGRYARRVGGYLWRMLRNAELVDEVVDDVMMIVWQKAATYEPRARVSTWVLGIAHNKALQARERMRKLDRERPIEDHDLAMPDPAPMANLGALAEDRDEMAKLKRGIAGLSEDHRAVVELAFFAGQSYQEIAEVVGCPVNTVKTRMFHARKQLGRIFATARADGSAESHERSTP